LVMMLVQVVHGRDPRGAQRLSRGWRSEARATRNLLQFEHTDWKRIVRVGMGVPAAERSVVRTLWCRGAPTRTCCGVIQGVKLRGQRRTVCQPQGGLWLGETWKVEEREDPPQGSSLRSGQRG
jgi:hypothetical protein